MIAKDLKFLILTLVLIIVLHFLLGYLFLGDFHAGGMVLIIGSILLIPVSIFNTIILYFSDRIERKGLRWSIVYFPIILFIAFIIILPLNAAFTPLVIILSLLISNTIWNLNYKSTDK